MFVHLHACMSQIVASVHTNISVSLRRLSDAVLLFVVTLLTIMTTMTEVTVASVTSAPENATLRTHAPRRHTPAGTRPPLTQRRSAAAFTVSVDWCARHSRGRRTAVPDHLHHCRRAAAAATQTTSRPVPAAHIPRVNSGQRSGALPATGRAGLAGHYPRAAAAAAFCNVQDTGGGGGEFRSPAWGRGAARGVGRSSPDWFFSGIDNPIKCPEEATALPDSVEQ